MQNSKTKFHGSTVYSTPSRASMSPFLRGNISQYKLKLIGALHQHTGFFCRLFKFFFPKSWFLAYIWSYWKFFSSPHLVIYVEFWYERKKHSLSQNTQKWPMTILGHVDARNFRSIKFFSTDFDDISTLAGWKIWIFGHWLIFLHK